MNKYISVNSEMFDSWQYNSARSAPQYEFNITRICYHGNSPRTLKAFLATLGFYIHICQWWPICMIQQAYLICYVKFMALFNVFPAENH